MQMRFDEFPWRRGGTRGVGPAEEGGRGSVRTPRTQHYSQARRWTPAVALALVVFIILIPTASMAQPVDEMKVIDGAGIFGSDLDEVEAAVAELEKRGAEVRVRTITTYSPYANLDQYELQLEDASPSWQGQDGNIKNNLIVMIIALNETESGIWYGDEWIDELNGNRLRIQTDTMYPHFSEGDYSGGVIAGLGEIGRVISAQGQAGTIDWTLLLAVLIIVAVAAAVVFILWHRRQSAKRSAWRQRAMLAKQTAAAGINEVLEANRMLEIKVDVTEKKVSPQEAAPMRDGLQKAATLVNRSSLAYSELGHSAGNPENPKLGAIELEHIEKEYLKIVSDLREAKEATKDVEDRIAAVQQAIDGYSLKVADVNASMEAVSVKERAMQAEGYRTTYVSKLLSDGREALARAQELVSQKRYTEGRKFAEQAGEHVQRASQALEELPRKKGEVDTAIPALESRIPQVKSAIVEGRNIFDNISNEYAESTWRSIRGNGTEAENRVNWAIDALNDAREMAAESDWHGAMEMVGKGNGLLSEAETLMRSIQQLEKDLLTARQDAPKEISAASEDIARAWEYIDRYDEDIRESLEDDLRAAERKNEAAKAELTLTQPDHFKACELARQANEAADRVLVQARSEHEAAERQRAKAASVRRDASAQLSIAREYIDDHSPVVKEEARRALKNAEGYVREAERTADLEGRISLFTRAEADSKRAYSLAQRDVENSWERPRSTSEESGMPEIVWPPIPVPGPGRSSTGRQPWGTTRSPGPGIPPGSSSPSGWKATGGSANRGGSSSWGGSPVKRGRRGGGSSGW